MHHVAIEAMLPADWPRVRAVLEEGIATGQATFETGVPDWNGWDASHCPCCRYVARLPGGRVVGWAALSPMSRRPAYSGAAEISVYVGQDLRGRGIGRLLLRDLVRCSEEQGFWTLQASVFPENEASLRLLAGGGFRVVGTRERIGLLHGCWRDVLLLERRSRTVF